MLAGVGFNTFPVVRKSAALARNLVGDYGCLVHAQPTSVVFGMVWVFVYVKKNCGLLGGESAHGASFFSCCVAAGAAAACFSDSEGRPVGGGLAVLPTPPLLHFGLGACLPPTTSS